MRRFAHRDVAGPDGPSYEFTSELATLGPPSARQQQLLGAICGEQEAMDDFVSINAGTVSPADFFSPANIGRLMSPPGRSPGGDTQL